MDAENNVAAVSVKLPTFWVDKAAVWFVQTEAQFAMRNVTVDQTKYFHVVAALDQDVATRVLDLLQNPPEQDKYQTLKDRLLQSFTLTESQRAASLLNINSLGDQKPSELMDKMLVLLGTHAPCFIFREIFLRQMPDDIRPNLAQANVADFRQLAQLADVLVAARYSPGLHAVGLQVTDKQRAADKHKTVTQSRTDDVCFYHRKFGNAAKQCRPPCSFRTTSQGNGQAGRQ